MSFISLFITFIDIIAYTFIICWILKLSYFIYSFLFRKPCNILKKYGTDSWALITGGTKGIGKEIAYILAEKGFNLFIIARDKDLLKNVSQEISTKFKVRVEYLSVDFSKYTKFEDYKLIFEEHFKNKPIRLLVNNVGIYYNESFKEISLEKTLNTITIHCYPQVYLSKLFIDNLKGTKGGIISISSLTADITISNMNVYSATKRFNDYISKGLSLEEKELDVLSVKPGACETDLVKAVADGWFVIKPSLCAKAIFDDFTYEKETNGYITHKIISYFISRFPAWFATFIAEQRKEFKNKNYTKKIN